MLPALLSARYRIGLMYFAPRYIVGSTTIWSGASYIYTKDVVKILSSEERARRGKP